MSTSFLTSSLGKQPSSKVSSFIEIAFENILLAARSSIDHHRTDPLFATTSNIVRVWDETKRLALVQYISCKNHIIGHSLIKKRTALGVAVRVGC